MEIQYPLIFFTLFMCLSAGMFTLQGYLLLVQKGTKKLHLTALIVEAVALVIGGIASFLHLHHWERIFNGFGHLTSGITQELIGVVVLAIAMVIVFVMLRRASEDDPAIKVARWVGIMALIVGVILGFVCAHSYYMPAIPAWSNITLYLFYYSSEFVLGAVGVWACAAVLKEETGLRTTLARVSLIAAVVSAVVIVICGFYYTTIQFDSVGIAFHTTEPTAPAVDPAGILASPFMGSNALLFWGGAVLIGSLVPALCAFLKMRKPEGDMPFSIAALVCALVGGVCFRVVLYIVGVSYYMYF